MVVFKNEKNVEDRREDLRFPIKVKAALKGEGGMKCLGTTENLSTTGALFNISQSTNADDLHDGQMCTFALMLTIDGQHSPVVFNCRIMHISERGVGIRFVSGEENSMELLEAFMVTKF